MKLDELIESLEKEIREMINLAITMVSSSIEYYFEATEDKRQEVIALEEEMNQYENKIDDHVVQVFALQQAFAIDLRKAVVMLKMNSNLERIGDLSYNITKRAYGSIQHEYYNASDKTAKNSFLLENHRLTMQLMQEVKNNYSIMSVDKVKELFLLDKKIDENNREVLRESLKASSENPEQLSFYLNHMTISKDLERIADHCKNLAISLVYMNTGENIKHVNIFSDDYDSEME